MCQCDGHRHTPTLSTWHESVWTLHLRKLSTNLTGSWHLKYPAAIPNLVSGTPPAYYPRNSEKNNKYPPPLVSSELGRLVRGTFHLAGCHPGSCCQYSGLQLLFFAPAKLIFSQKVCSASISKELSYLVDVRNRYLRSSKYLMLKTKLSAFKWSATGFNHHVILSPLAKVSCLQSCISSALYSFLYCVTTLLCLVDNYSCLPVYNFLVAILHTSP